MRKLRKNIDLGRYKSDMTRDRSYIFVLVDRNIACSSTLCTVNPPIGNGSGMPCKRVVLRLLRKIMKLLSFLKIVNWVKIFTIASFTIMMAFLTAKFSFEESFGTFWMTFTASKLPVFGTSHTLIPSRTTTCITAQVTFDATAPVAVIAVKWIIRETISFICSWQLFNSQQFNTPTQKKWIFNEIDIVKLNITVMMMMRRHNKIVSGVVAIWWYQKNAGKWVNVKFIKISSSSPSSLGGPVQFNLNEIKLSRIFVRDMMMVMLVCVVAEIMLSDSFSSIY